MSFTKLYTQIIFFSSLILNTYQANAINLEEIIRNNDIEELIIVELTYTVTEGTFQSSDTVTLTF